MGNLINPQAAGANFGNFGGFGPQYGSQLSSTASGLGNVASLAAGGIGSVVGAGMNLLGMYMQNKQQERFYNQYMSPSAQMAQMRKAGINPNLAAQGISGSGPANMQAASMSEGAGVSGNIASLIGNSVNNALTASNIQADTSNKIADTEVKKETGRLVRTQADFEVSTFDDRAAALKKANKLTDYQIEQLRPYAENADQWYKINFDNLNEQVNKLRKEQKEIDEQIENLKKQRKLWDSEIGVNESTKRYNDAMTELTNKKKEIIESLGAEDAESAFVRAKLEGDEKKAEAIENGIKEYNKSVEEGHQSGDTMNKERQRIIASYDEQIERAEAYLKECEDEYYKANSWTKPWKHGTMEAARNRLKNLQEDKMEALRRLESNSSESVNILGIGGSKNK